MRCHRRGFCVAFILAALTGLIPVPIEASGQYYEGLRDPKIVGLGGEDYPKLEPGVRGGTFHMAVTYEPQSWNPLVDESSANTFYTSQVFRGLVGTNPRSGMLVCELAKSWEIGLDNRTITFHLRAGVKWSDGTPFTAEDVIFTYNKLLLYEELSGSGYLPVLPDGTHPTLHIVGRYTIVVTFSQPYRPLLAAFDFPILPAHRLAYWVPGEEDPWQATYADLGEICGLGPYIPHEYVPGSHVIMIRNPHYYVYDQNGTQLPYCDRYVIALVPDGDTALLMFKNGESYVLDPRPVDIPILNNEADVRGFTLYIGDVEDGVWGTEFIAFNQDLAASQTDPTSSEPSEQDTTGDVHHSCPPYIPPHCPANVPSQLLDCWEFSAVFLKEKQPPYTDRLQILFRDLRFRQAVAHALDKQNIIDSVYNGLAVPIWSPVDVASPFYAGRDGYGGPITEADAVLYHYDLERAGELLDEIGIVDTDGDGFREFSDGTPVEFELITNAENPLREGLCRAIKEGLAKIGIQVNFNPVAFYTLVSKLLEGEYEAAVLGLSGGFEPNGAADVYCSTGGLHFWHYSAVEGDVFEYEKRIDELFGKAVTTYDDHEAFEHYKEYQRLFASQDMGLIFTVRPLLTFAYYNYVGNAVVANAITPEGVELAWDLLWLKSRR